MNHRTIRTAALVTAALLVIFVTRPGNAQEPVKKENHKKIILKVIADDNGNRTVIDTTLDLPDSTILDSVHREIDRVIRVGKEGHSRHHFGVDPDKFTYDFDLRSFDDSMKELDKLKDLEFEWDGALPGEEGIAGDLYDMPLPAPECNMIGKADRQQTLSDLIGDIPMDRVTGYTVKDRKHGKRIIVDVEDGPIFDRHDKNVIIIREPGKVRHLNNLHPQKKVRVFVNPKEGSREKIDSDVPEPPAPPTPPPPPPVDKTKEPKKKI
ncbi:MAG TPA: hypothetical protein PKN44_15035 [Bacteroidales bacterium]|nr:hypothetical protein [Bacteroidales bacterium]